MRQKTLRVFEIDNFDKLQKIVESKYELIKNHYFLLKEHNKEIEDFLKKHSLSYFITNDQSFITTTPKKEVIEKVVVEEKIIEKIVNKPCDSMIYTRIIRSGEEINSDKHLVFLNRINAGAKIISSASISIFAECEGDVICDGDFIIVKYNKKGTIIFKGEDIGEIENLTIITETMKKALL